MAQMVFSKEDVPLEPNLIRSYHRRWRYPNIIPLEGDSIPHSIIDRDGEAHYGISAQNIELRQRLQQSDYQLKGYPSSQELFRTLFGEVESALPPSVTTKEKIIYAKLIFGDEKTAPSNSIFGFSTPISREYANEFKYDPESERIFQREQIPRSLRKELINQYGGCSKCGQTEGVEIHHIIPYIEDGPTEKSNLAPLCGECHTKAHQAYQDRSSGYNSVEGFWNWIDR